MRRLIIFGAPLLLAASLAASASGGGPLKTAVVQPSDLRVADAPLIFSRIRGAGASLSRVTLDWYAIAPKALPASFDPENPSDPAYDWTALDAIVQAAFAEGLEPYLAVNSTPGLGADRPEGRRSPSDPRGLREVHARGRVAVQRRLSGLPRIRYWQIWIEPNVNKFFRPPARERQAGRAQRYAAIVNAAADAIHAVRADNKVIAGGLSPFTVTRGDTSTIGPWSSWRTCCA